MEYIVSIKPFAFNGNLYNFFFFSHTGILHILVEKHICALTVSMNILFIQLMEKLGVRKWSVVQ